MWSVRNYIVRLLVDYAPWSRFHLSYLLSGSATFLFDFLLIICSSVYFFRLSDYYYIILLDFVKSGYYWNLHVVGLWFDNLHYSCVVICGLLERCELSRIYETIRTLEIRSYRWFEIFRRDGLFERFQKLLAWPTLVQPIEHLIRS